MNELVLLVPVDERWAGPMDVLVRKHCFDRVSVEDMEALVVKFETEVGQRDPGAKRHVP